MSAVAQPPRVSGAQRLAEWACWAYILVAAGRVVELVPALLHIPIAKIIIVIWALAVFAAIRDRSSLGLWRIPFIRTVAAMLVLAVVSFSFSIWKRQSVDWFINVGPVLVVSVTLFFLTATHPGFFRRALGALVVAAAALAAAALLTFDGSRVEVGLTYDTNDLAYFMVTVLPIVIAFGLLRRGVPRLVLFGLAGSMVLVVLLTQSRGGLLGLICVTVGMTIWPIAATAAEATPDRAAAQRRRGPVLKWLGRAIGVAFLGMVVWFVAPQESKERFESLLNLQSDYNFDEGERRGRIAIWKRNLDRVVERPIGFGVGASGAADYHAGGVFMALHSAYLEILVELGFLGLVLFLRVLWLSWKSTGRVGADPPSAPQDELPMLARALRLSLIGWAVCSLFLSVAYANLSWILFSCIAAIEWVRFQSAAPVSPAARAYARGTAAVAPRGRSRGERAVLRR